MGACRQVQHMPSRASLPSRLYSEDEEIKKEFCVGQFRPERGGGHLLIMRYSTEILQQYEYNAVPLKKQASSIRQWRSIAANFALHDGREKI